MNKTIAKVVMLELIPAMSLYSRDFSKKFGNELESVISEFVEVICKAGLSEQQVRMGIDVYKLKAATAPWSVNPTEFLMLCGPVSQLGEIEVLEAFTRMIEHKSAMTDVEHAARLKCAYQCRNQLPQDKALVLFTSHMKAFSAKQARGEFIPSRDTKLLERKGQPRQFNQDFEAQIGKRVARTSIEIRMLKLQMATKRRKAFRRRKAQSSTRTGSAIIQRITAFKRRKANSRLRVARHG
jgi:hypothetical protein